MLVIFEIYVDATVELLFTKYSLCLLLRGYCNVKYITYNIYFVDTYTTHKSLSKCELSTGYV